MFAQLSDEAEEYLEYEDEILRRLEILAFSSIPIGIDAQKAFLRHFGNLIEEIKNKEIRKILYSQYNDKKNMMIKRGLNVCM